MSSSSHQWKPDVFVSFRGTDIRNNFMSHLFYRLNQAGISCFRDDNREDAGKEIQHKLREAISQTRFALVIFSTKYADSTWCLNELVDILKCKHENPKLVVIPIFYIDTDEVSKWLYDDGKCKFEQALKSVDKNARAAKKEVWKRALAEAKGISGYELKTDGSRNESKLIEIIVERLIKEIHQIRPVYFVKDAIGIDDLAKDVISLLNKGDKKGVRMVGICGPEGIGKTTMAGVAFDLIRDEFKYFIFLAKIGEANETDRLDQQKKLLQQLGGGQGCSNVIGTNTNEIKERMRGKKILLVLDGVTDKKQVEEFGAEKFSDKGKTEIGEGSRILITARDRALLKELKVDDEYVVKGLSEDVARQLFCHHALKTERPEQDFKKLSESLTHYAGGHPLTLKRLGSYVSDEPINHWRKTLDKLVRSASSLSIPMQSVGPCKGQDGGAYTGGVRQFTVRVESVINSIAIDCNKDGCLVCSCKHGEHPDGKIVPLLQGKLVYPNEYRTPIDSIGADFGPSSRAYPFEVVGPFGVVDGKNRWEDKGYTDVREIVVCVGDDSTTIKSINVIYDKNGRSCKSDRHGTEGVKSYSIKLNYPSEYLTTISGYIGEVSGLITLRSLTIHTNVKCYMPFGKEEGKKFSFPYTGGKIVGFHGSCNGSHLESIGAFYKPIPHTYPVRVFGPFGGEDKGEKSWDFVNGIDVHYADFIKSIAFEVDDANSSEPKTDYGGNGGEKTFQVKLRNGEYITSFAGYMQNVSDSDTQINSLTFQTNKRILGPIGREEGVYFSLPSEAGKVIKFFGTSGDYLESIGAQVEPNYPFKSVGLFGSSEDSIWDDGNEYINVRRIIVKCGSSVEPFIRTIAFQYEKENKESRLSATSVGITTREKTGPIKIHGPDGDVTSISGDNNVHNLDSDEYLTSMSGYTFQPDKRTIGGITSLTLQTNKRTIGPFGVEKGRHFSSPATGGKIVGFYGRSGKYLEAIGAHFEPILNLYPVKRIGPFGDHLGRGGSCWDDREYNGVKRIEVMHNDVILSIKFLYDDGSAKGHLVMHGGRTGEDKTKVASVAEVTLDYPREYFTSISGYSGYTKADGAVIWSLAFHSNRRMYGPFGDPGETPWHFTGKYFWYPSTGSRIIGFFGRCGKTLNSIGVYAQPIPHLHPFKTVGPFGDSGETPWDDGVHSDVRGFLVIANGAIQSIKIVYDNKGSFVLGSEHGEKGNAEYDKVLLDYPKERLLTISGCVNRNGRTPDFTTIQDLRIQTTKKLYGPYAWSGWSSKSPGTSTKFCIPSSSGDGRIVGFFGSSTGSLLKSIGARLEPY